MATLDRSRPFGSIINDRQGCVFEQDGNFFNGDGSAWIDPAAPAKALIAAKSAKPTTKAPAAAGSTVTDNQLSAQLGA